jgi:hypothetical protein
MVVELSKYTNAGDPRGLKSTTISHALRWKSVAGSVPLVSPNPNGNRVFGVSRDLARWHKSPKLSASGVDLVAFALADFELNPGVFQDRAELG